MFIRISANIVHAFTDSIRGGNPAAVIQLNTWLKDEDLQALAAATEQPVTAFILQSNPQYWQIRWFSQLTEINLCGHGTLAAAHVLFNKEDSQQAIRFSNQHGELTVLRSPQGYSISMPKWQSTEIEDPVGLSEIIGGSFEFHRTRDLIVVLTSEAEVRSFNPDFEAIRALGDFHGVLVTARGDKTDYVLRFFVPKIGINEDPATGSAQCSLAPFWANRLGKHHLTAKQLSKRGGKFAIDALDDRLLVHAPAVSVDSITINL